MTAAIAPRYFALIPAAGVGARMAAGCPKQYLHLAGKSILQHSVNAFLSHPRITHVFVVVSPEDGWVATELQLDARLTVLFCGGATRAESVLNGLQTMQAQVDERDWVLVHDAARPGLSTQLVSLLIDTVGDDEVGGLLALPVADTLKLASGVSVQTLPRTGMWLAQTPQMFRHARLFSALQQASDVTDDASAIEACGLVPKLVQGHWCNSKITRPDDLALIATYLEKQV